MPSKKPTQDKQKSKKSDQNELSDEQASQVKGGADIRNYDLRVGDGLATQVNPTLNYKKP